MVPGTPTSCEDLLAVMVGFDTVNAHASGRADAEAELAHYLAGVARAAGLQARELPIAGRAHNLLVVHEVRPQAPWLLCESHLDTVSAAGMSVDPFAARVRSGRLYGRGACDTKGTGAAMLWALREYAQAGGGPTNVAIVYTVDEEIGKTGVRAFSGAQLPRLGWRPVGVVIGEPTLLRPVVAHNGIARWTIRTRGMAAHSSDPSQGKSAISMMLRVVDAIEGDYAPSLSARHPLTGRAQCSVNVIRGGTQVNIIPDRCEVEVDRRVVPGEDNAAVVPAVEALLDGLRARHPGLQVEQEEPYLDPPLDPAGGEAFAAHVCEVLQALGLDGKPVGMPCGTDASQFSAIGVPAVVLGPGSIEQAHTRDEWLALDQLHRGVEVYLRLMRASWEELP
ncbi:MAG: M20 family metallopeptidase [Candidatus Latescibacterota bacterium]